MLSTVTRLTTNEVACSLTVRLHSEKDSADYPRKRSLTSKSCAGITCYETGVTRKQTRKLENNNKIYYQTKNEYNQLLQICTARTAWSDSVIRSASVRFGKQACFCHFR